MDPDRWPLDLETTALVLRVIDDIDERDDEMWDALLADLLCAAWGSVRAQNQ